MQKRFDLKLSHLRPWQASQLSPIEQAFFDRHSVRTDLAFEAHQVVREAGQETIPGVTTQTEDLGFATVTRIEVDSDIGAAVLGKAQGRYVTIHAPGLRKRDRLLEKDLGQTLAREIQSYLDRLGIPVGAPVLVVGLGNWNATPDNIGPLTVSKLLVTRHLFEYQALPDELLSRMRPVAALSPGVLGLTGMETAEIVQAVVERVRPAAVFCVDALASMSVERIGTTVQVSDAGISPGSGVGNTRKGLSQQTLGVPVIAMGVPTVIYATTIVSDAVDQLLAHTASQANGAQAGSAQTGSVQGGGTQADSAQTEGSLLDPNRIIVTPSARPAEHQPTASPGFAAPDASAQGPDHPVFGLDPESRRTLIRQVLGDSMGTLIVTPKEVDVMVDTLSDILADGLNEALHPGITAEEAAQIR